MRFFHWTAVVMFFGLPVWAQDAPNNVWQEAKPYHFYYDRNYPSLFTKIVAGSRQIDLALFLSETGNPDDNFFLLVSLPGARRDTIEIAIEMPGGQTLHQKWDSADFVKVDTNERGDQTYQLGLLGGNLDVFRKARLLHIASLPDARAAMTNAPDAIDVALERGRLQALGQSDQLAAMTRWCDLLAAHPLDENSATRFGVKWKDIRAEFAYRACDRAIAAGATQPRILYQKGRVLDKLGHESAVDFIRKAALEMNYAIAYFHLGILYQFGDYVEKDEAAAEQYYRQGSRLGSIKAKSQLGKLLVQKGETKERLQEGKILLQEAGRLKDPGALVHLGTHLLRGTFGTSEPLAAETVLTQALKFGEPEAAYELAQVYRRGPLANSDKYLEKLRLARQLGSARAKKELEGE